MAKNISSEFNNTLYQLQGIFNQMGGSSIKGGSYINSVFGIANSVGQIASGDSNQQAAGIQSLIKQAMSLVENLVSIQTKVDKRVNEDRENAEKIAKEAEETKIQLNNEITKVGDDINVQTDIVNQATSDINETQEALQEMQEEINNIIAEIEAKQKDLAEATTTEEKIKLLQDIETLGLNITAITSDIESYQEIISSAASNIENAVINIETAKGNIVEIQENGELSITKATQEVAQTTGDVVATKLDGAKNITLGTALETSAAGESIIPIVGGALASQTAQKGAELISAGTVEETGAVANLQTLLQGIGKVAENTQLLSTFRTAIGGALKTFNSAVGSWNTAINPVIQSIGSFTGDNSYTQKAEELVETVNIDYHTIETQEQEDSQGKNQDVVKEIELKTPKFSFGI